MTHLQTVATILSIPLLLLFLFIIFAWRGYWAAMIIKDFTREKTESYYKKLRIAAFTCLSLMIACMATLGSFSSLNVWIAIFYVSCVPILCLGVRNLTKGSELLTTKLVSSNWINFILVDLPLHYIFPFVYVRLMMQLIW